MRMSIGYSGIPPNLSFYNYKVKFRKTRWLVLSFHSWFVAGAHEPWSWLGAIFTVSLVVYIPPTHTHTYSLVLSSKKAVTVSLFELACGRGVTWMRKDTWVRQRMTRDDQQSYRVIPVTCLKTFSLLLSSIFFSFELF